MPVEVTLIDRRNFHLFQPLAYQVSTGALSAAEICYPLRRIVRRRRNVRVVLAEVTGLDLENRLVLLGPIAGEPPPEAIPYDTLIVSGGVRYTYGQHTTAQPGRRTKSGHPDEGRLSDRLLGDGFRIDRPAALTPGCCLPDAATVSLDAPIPDWQWLLPPRADSAVWRSRRER